MTITDTITKYKTIKKAFVCLCFVIFCVLDANRRRVRTRHRWPRRERGEISERRNRPDRGERFQREVHVLSRTIYGTIYIYDDLSTFADSLRPNVINAGRMPTYFERKTGSRAVVTLRARLVKTVIKNCVFCFSIAN